MLSLTRRLVRLRRDRPALATGAYRPIDATPDGTFCFVRSVDGGDNVLVALNMTAEPRRVPLGPGRGRILEGTHPDRAGTEVEMDALDLRADEGLVAEPERAAPS
jgi:hypothetical protein